MKGVVSAGEWTRFQALPTLADGKAPAVAVAEMLGRVASLLRGYVANKYPDIMGPAGTVPPELEECAAIHAIQFFCTRMPGMGMVFDEPRQERLRNAVKTMRDVGMGNMRPTDGRGAEAVPAVQGAPGMWGSQPSIFTGTR